MIKTFGVINPTMNMYMTYDTLLGSSKAGAQLKLLYHWKVITHNYIFYLFLNWLKLVYYVTWLLP